MEIRNAIRNRVARLWARIKNQIVQDVPEDLALCEFACRKSHCTMGDWETCDRRVRDAGEASRLI